MNKNFFIVTAICILFVQEMYAQQNNSVATKNKIIKIGLLISDTKSVEAKNAAQMAINKANKMEGKNRIHFQLVVKSMEGPWGTGSKQAVDLIFKDNVWAIVGSHDGQNAHLVEQVIAKMQTVFLSTWASDATLSQAFVPWYFSCVPNNNQQANIFIKEIYRKKSSTKVVTIADKSYDSKLAVNSFVKRVKMAGKVTPMQLYFDNSKTDIEVLFNQINKSSINCVMLFCKPVAAINIIEQMHQKKMNQSVFGALSIMGENKFSEMNLANYKNVKVLNSLNWLDPKKFDFQTLYQKKYGKTPSVQAAYAYDGMTIIIKAIKQSGFNIEKLQKVISDIDYKGVTGLIQFDEKGNRMGNNGLIEVKNGNLVIVKK